MGLQRIAAQRGPQSAPAQRGPVASGEQYIDKLSEEFNRKRNLFDDDLSFIKEVKAQETPASGMDPDTELQTLHKRFSNWKKEFKVSHATMVCQVLGRRKISLSLWLPFNFFVTVRFGHDSHCTMLLVRRHEPHYVPWC